MKKLLKVLLILVCIPLVAVAVGIGFLKFADLNKYKPQIEDLALKYANTKIVINGDLDIGVSLKPSLELNDVEIYMPQQPEVKLAHIGSALVQISIMPLFHKEIMIDTVQTSQTKIFASGDEVAEIKDLTAMMDGYEYPITAIFDTDVSGISINGTLTLSSLKDLRTVNFDESQVTLMAEALGYKLNFDGIIRGLQSALTADGNYDLSYKSNQISGTVSADLSGDLPYVNLSAASDKINVADWLEQQKATFDWLISSAQAADYIAGTEIPYEYLQQANADVTLNIKKVAVNSALSVNNLQANLSLQNGVFKANLQNADTLGAKFSGSASINSPKSLPYIKLNINSNNLDLQKLQFAQNEPEKIIDFLLSSAQASSLMANTPIPYQYFGMANADVALNVKKMQVNSDISLADIVADLNLKNSVFKANIKSLKAGDGNITGTMTVDAKNQTAAADMKVANVILQKLYAPYAKADNPYLYIKSGGVVNGLIKVTTSGKNTDAYLSNLTGQVIVFADKSVVNIKSLDRLKGNIIVQILDNLKLNITKQDMTMKCAVVRTDIQSGRMNFPKGIVLNAKEFYIVADGNINLQNDSLNLSLQPFSGKITDVNISSLLGSLLKIKGTITQPKLSINQTQTAKSVIGAIASAGVYNVGDMMLTADNAPCHTALTGTAYADYFPADTSIKGGVSKGYQSTQDAVVGFGKEIKSQAKGLKNQAKEIGNQLKGLFKN